MLHIPIYKQTEKKNLNTKPDNIWNCLENIKISKIDNQPPKKKQCT